jgi:hypothetical protein
MLLSALRVSHPESNYYFKMSGRYRLNDNFSLSSWSSNGWSFLCLNPEYYSTRLYGFSANSFAQWVSCLFKGLPFCLLDYPIEHTLAKFVPRKFVTCLTELGITGVGASSRDTILE